VQAQPPANLALISVPGAYAAREVPVALELGLHVLLFSDNVSLEDEVALKRLAVDRGLLLNGVPLGFANQVRCGHTGIVGASGTGMQEVSCLIDAMGYGISQAIGTGGRDLQERRIGGLMTLQGIAALAADTATEVVVVIAKPSIRR
jgi:succinyl-CoA synthetase alpha subunit